MSKYKKFTFTFIRHLGKTHNHRSRGDTPCDRGGRNLYRKVFFCLTGPYLTRRATIGKLANPPLAEGGSFATSLRATPTSITANTARGSSD